MVLRETIVRTARMAKRWGVGLLIGAMVHGISGVSTAQAVPPVSCPFNIPVVILAPHQAGGFSWGPVIRPMNDPCLGSIAVDPTSDSVWYVGGLNGLYMTKDGGQTWTHPLSGSVSALVLVPGKPQLIYVGVANKLVAWASGRAPALGRSRMAFMSPSLSGRLYFEQKSK